jgi:hypothetical protein
MSVSDSDRLMIPESGGVSVQDTEASQAKVRDESSGNGRNLTKTDMTNEAYPRSSFSIRAGHKARVRTFVHSHGSM